MNRSDDTPLKNRTAGKLDRIDWAFILGAMATAIVLGLLYLGHRSLWLDEVSSITNSRDLKHLLDRMASSEANMWLYLFIMHGWQKLSDSEFMVRGLSVIFAVLTVPAVFGLARALFGSVAARMAVTLLVVNAFYIHYAQEARAYSLFIFLSALSGYFFVAAVRRPNPRLRGGYALTAALSVYAQLFGVLNLAVQGLAWLATRPKIKEWPPWMLSWAAVILLLLPLPLYHHNLAGSGQLNWVLRPSILELPRLAKELAGGRKGLLLAYVLLCLLSLGLVIRNRRRNRATDLWPQTFAWLWLLLPPITAYLFSLWVKPVFIDRYLAACLVPYVLLAGSGLAGLPAGRWRYMALAVMVILSLNGVFRWYALPPHEEWREAAAGVAAQARPGDAAIFHIPTVRRPFEYYYHRLGRAPNEPAFLELPQWGRGPNPDNRPVLDTLAALPQKYDRVWLILSHHDMTGTSRQTAQTKILKEVLGQTYESVTVTNLIRVEVRLYSP